MNLRFFSSNPKSLSILPDEIWLKIAAYLSFKDLQHFASVCKYFLAEIEKQNLEVDNEFLKDMNITTIKTLKMGLDKAFREKKGELEKHFRTFKIKKVKVDAIQNLILILWGIYTIYKLWHAITGPVSSTCDFQNQILMTSCEATLRTIDFFFKVPVCFVATMMVTVLIFQDKIILGNPHQIQWQPLSLIKADAHYEKFCETAKQVRLSR